MYHIDFLKLTLEGGKIQLTQPNFRLLIPYFNKVDARIQHPLKQVSPNTSKLVSYTHHIDCL